MLGVDVTDPTVPGVLPGDDGAADAVGRDVGQAPIPGRGAQGAAVRGPGQVYEPFFQHVLGVDAGAAATIAPSDDGAARSVLGDGGPPLVSGGGAQGATSWGPADIQRPRVQDALGVDIVIGAAAAVLPGDDGAARA